MGWKLKKKLSSVPLMIASLAWFLEASLAAESVPEGKVEQDCTTCFYAISIGSAVRAEFISATAGSCMCFLKK